MGHETKVLEAVQWASQKGPFSGQEETLTAESGRTIHEADNALANQNRLPRNGRGSENLVRPLARIPADDESPMLIEAG